MGFFDSINENTPVTGTSGAQTQQGSASGVTVTAGDDQNATVNITNELIDHGVVDKSLTVAITASRDGIKAALFGAQAGLNTAKQIASSAFGVSKTSINALSLSARSSIAAGLKTQLDAGKTTRSSISANTRTILEASKIARGATASGERTFNKAAAFGVSAAAQATAQARSANVESGKTSRAALSTANRALSDSAKAIRGATASGERTFNKATAFGVSAAAQATAQARSANLASANVSRSALSTANRALSDSAKAIRGATASGERTFNKATAFGVSAAAQATAQARSANAESGKTSRAAVASGERVTKSAISSNTAVFSQAQKLVSSSQGNITAISKLALTNTNSQYQRSLDFARDVLKDNATSVNKQVENVATSARNLGRSENSETSNMVIKGGGILIAMLALPIIYRAIAA
ncbi:MAG: hypothetical protein COB04_18785 [Gammaproteobacteria bacterium]|nr:MAG: hypothetical protein COB04_18785 [Gammaproteobacteria bacterium]